MLSKELLSEVLGLDIYEDDKKFSELLNINSISDNVNYNIRFLKDIENGWTEAIGNRWINTHELAHKCKEWAFKQGYYLTIYNDAIDVILKTNCKTIENITNGSYLYDYNLVFKACQWILEKQIEEDSKKQQQEDKEEYNKIIKEGVKWK